MWPWHVKMPTQKLLRLLLLLMLVMRIVLATVCCRFGGWSLVIKLNFCSDLEHFGQDFEVEVKAGFWSWSLVSILLMMFGWSQILVNILKLGLVKILTLYLVEMLILKSMLNRDSEIVYCSRFVNCELWSCDMNSTLGSVVPLAMFLDFPQNFRLSTRNQYCTQSLSPSPEVPS